MSVDDFIDDAKAYARGRSLLQQNEADKPVTQRNYKKATFTLTPDNIVTLSDMSESSGVAKSKIVRYLLSHFRIKNADWLKQLTALKQDKA